MMMGKAGFEAVVMNLLQVGECWGCDLGGCTVCCCGFVEAAACSFLNEICVTRHK